MPDSLIPQLYHPVSGSTCAIFFLSGFSGTAPTAIASYLVILHRFSSEAMKAYLLVQYFELYLSDPITRTLAMDVGVVPLAPLKTCEKKIAQWKACLIRTWVILQYFLAVLFCSSSRARPRDFSHNGPDFIEYY
ncbi:hypothetical protein BDC45DRAFT_530958 [Circinella umbellata]|nr:hypothetical protein BDC45DRAFT_530958 [Circinella umbellata]